MFPTRVYANPKPVFWLFSTSRNPFFVSTSKPGYFKSLELLLHSNISNSDNTEVEEWCVQRAN